MEKIKTPKKTKKESKFVGKSMPTNLPYKVKEVEQKYRVTLQFNGEEFDIKTNNLIEAITAIKPEILYTELYITISDGQNEFQKRFNLVQGKRLFASDEMMDVFISTMLF